MFDLAFDHKVVKVEDVTDGGIEDTVIPVSMWAPMDSDTIRVLLELPGTTTVSGSGYLAKITFKVKGDEGDESALELSDGELVKKLVFEDGMATPEEITAEWIDAKFRIASLPIHNIVHNIHTGENFSSIQDAIDDPDTKGGHTITVSGTYSEHVVVNKQLNLNGVDFPEISAGGNGSAIKVVHDGCEIEGFCVRWGDAGINVESDNNILRDNIASNNLQGIHLVSANNNTLVNNTANTKNNYGIHLKSSSNNTITNNNASGNYWNGICLDSSSKNLLGDNSINANSNYGIFLDFASNNTLLNNRMAGNKYNFGVFGGTFSDFYQNIDTSNFVGEKPIYYWVDQKDQQIPDDAGFVGIVNCTNITVSDLRLRNNSAGVLLAFSNNSKIENITTSNNNYEGVYLYYSNNNRISNSNASKNHNGLYLRHSSSNLISSNNVSNNHNGMIYFRSSNNKIYPNNFVNNTHNVYSSYSGLANIWNSAVKIAYTYNGTIFTNRMGNYWSDYRGTDADKDGIGDSPYHINGAIKDNYPLMEPIENYFAPVENIVNTGTPANPPHLSQACTTGITHYDKGEIGDKI